MKEQKYQLLNILPKMTKDELFLSNLYIVDGIINKLYYSNYLHDDLRQVALMGLFRAANSFDEKYNVKFSTYATYFVLGEIKKELRNNKLIKTGKKVTKVIKLLKENYTLKEIKEQTKFEDDIIYTGLMYKENIKSTAEECLDIETDNNDKLFTDINIVLKGDLYDVIKYKYYQNYTQKEIGKIMGISQSKVSRLEKTALMLLKKYYY